MAGISGMLTNFNTPNYHGELFLASPQDTPFLSSIGGLTGGGVATSTEFEWQTEDDADPSQPVIAEGASAPASTGRARSRVSNVVQIHQERVSVSWTNQSTMGQFTTTSSAPYNTSEGVGVDGNPVQNEKDHQIAAKLRKIAKDVEWSFINGKFRNPSTNTGRSTRGLVEAITTNVLNLGAATGTGLSAATDTITEATTPVANGDKVVFTDIGASTTLRRGRKYYVRDKAAGSFKVAATPGGAAITIGTATVSYILASSSALTLANVNGICQQAFDNGGLRAQATATLMVGSGQKLALSAAIAAEYAKAQPVVGNVGGVVVEQVQTDFGVLNVMLNRYIPDDALIITSLEMCKPVLLNVPGKGVFFEKEIVTDTSADDVMLYGEIGLAYGLESAHGIIRGAKIAV